MNGNNNFSDNSIFDHKDILNQDLTPQFGVENIDQLVENKDGAYTDLVAKSADGLSPLEPSSLIEESDAPLLRQSEDYISGVLADGDDFTGNNSSSDIGLDGVSDLIPSTIDGEAIAVGQLKTVSLAMVSRDAGYFNEVGLYKVDNSDGRIGNLMPGDNGYAAAALAPERVVATLGVLGTDTTAAIEPGSFIGSYLIQNGTTQRFLQKNSRNRTHKTPLAFFSFTDSNPDQFDHVQTSTREDGSINLAWEDLTGGGDQDFDDLIVNVSFSGEVEEPVPSDNVNYAIKAEGKVVLTRKGDYDGDPLDTGDDARIYAGDGFAISGRPTLPVQRDNQGNPILNEFGREVLVDNAVTVAEGYSASFVSHSNRYSGLVPPQIVEAQTVAIPDYAVTKQFQLDSAIGEDSLDIRLDVPDYQLRNAYQWSNNFPAPGTVDNPTIVRVGRRGLTIPNQVDLSNYVIIAEQGDIKFKGNGHNLDNVVLIAEQGKIELSKVEANNSSFLAEKAITVKSGNTFTGENLIANEKNKIEFTSAAHTPGSDDSLTVIAAGNLSFRGRSELRGEFSTVKDLKVMGHSSFYGSLAAKQDITLNGKVKVFAVPNQSEIAASLESVTVTEGNSTVATLTVVLSGPSNEAVSIDYGTADDTAVAGSDYQAVSGTLNFNPGEISKTIEIPIVDDGINEGDEAFKVSLSNPVGVALANESAIVNITNDDLPPELSINSIEVAEASGTGSVTVSLSAPSSFPVTVDFATVDGEAVAGSDYQAQSGTLTFAPGETSKTIAVEIINDSLTELTEAFQVELSNSSRATIVNSAGVITVTDDDLANLALELNLANDTGVDSTDKISADATVTGVIDNIQGDINVSAIFAEGNNPEGVDISELIGPDGEFTLGIEQLKLINGGDLDDGTYTLQLTANDSATGNSIEGELVFTLDTTAPTLTLTTPIVDGNHSSKPRLTGTTETADLASVTYSLDGIEIGPVTVDDNGNFDTAIDDNGLGVGNHTVTAIATDLVGNQTSSEVSFFVGNDFSTPGGTSGWGVKNESTLILGEQDSYVVQTSVPVELGLATNEEGEQTGTRTISFDLATVFDDTDAKATEDQLLVYLVDPANPSQTLLGNGSEGTAVFSLAGAQADFTPGLVGFDGTTVTIDASSLTDATEGQLVFQLLNQDDDTGSVVTVNNLTSTTDLEGFANPIFPQDNNLVAAGEQ